MPPTVGSMHKNRATGCRGPPEEASGNACPPVNNPACAASKKYGEVLETVILDFTENDVTCVASKLFSAAGAPGADATELRNLLLRFGCVSE